MPGRSVYVVCADGEEDLAELIARPLRDAGYDVAHNGTIAVGESLVGEAQRALASSSPIVLCATAKAAGSAWAHQVVNAAHTDGPVRVFVVQMEKQAFVKGLAFNGKVARYCDDPAKALDDLLGALNKHFPPSPDIVERPTDESHAADRQILDDPIESTTFDVNELQKFRSELRKDMSDRYPSVLTEWEFLHRTGLRVGERLTGTGALLFAKDPSVAFPAAIIKCARYYGTGRAAEREIRTFEGTVTSQIIGAREFVADRVRIGESPSPHQAQSAILYEYPMIAVREVIANALVHRDYSAADTCVHIRLFTDRLEVSSPGNWLAQSLLPDKEYDLADLAGQSIKRNFRLAHILSWARLVEGEGSGIPTALLACHADHSPNPTVREEQGFVTVTMRKRPGSIVATSLAPRNSSSTQIFLARYRRHVVEQFGKLQPPDFDRRRRIPLSDSYVSPTVMLRSGGQMRTLDIWQFDEEIGHAVLLGDPGGGKTTACQVLMHKHASDDQYYIPFLITLRDFAAHDPPERSVAGYIEHTLETFYQCPAPVGAIEQLLLTGDVLIMFDGLDELLDGSRRAEMSARVERFCAEYPYARVLVTSRLAGYNEARLDETQFTEYQFGGFDYDRVREFAHKWFAHEEAISSNVVDAFLDEIAAIADLSSNPLLLSLLCILYRGQGTLPRKRTEIYEQCANLLFRKWDARRHIAVDLRIGYLLEPALRHLAWWVFNRENDSTSVIRHDLVRETTSFLQSRGFESELDAEEAAAEFIEFCRGRAWVFSDVGTTVNGEALYSFTHRTFLEYFAAAHLAHSSDTPETLADNLASRITAPKWEVVGQLSIQMKDRTSERGAERVITALINGKFDWTADEQASISRFVMRYGLISDLPPTLVRRIEEIS